MIKQIELAIRFEHVRHGPDFALEVLFDRDAIHAWTLGLILLKEHLTDALAITELGGKSTLELRRSGVTRRRAQAVVAESTIRLLISDDELDAIASFFLKYFRDGAAEVDHVDVQALSGDTGAECYITLTVPDCTPPVSADDAKKRLGLR